MSDASPERKTAVNANLPGEACQAKMPAFWNVAWTLLVVVAGPLLATSLPIPRTPRARLAEAAVIVGLLIAAQQPIVSQWLQANPAPLLSVSAYLIARLVRSPLVISGSSPEIDEWRQDPVFGAHTLYTAPLLAAAISITWMTARGAPAIGTRTTAFVLFMAVRSQQRPVHAAVWYSFILLAFTGVHEPRLNAIQAAASQSDVACAGKL